ncbi:MAG: hypothetical protein V4757_24275 [Pseudomonadota bacterium]
MDEFLSNPAVQAGVLPFVVSLVVAAALCRTRLMALAVAAAFFTVVALVLGFSFESLTATRKLVLAGIGTTAAILVIEGMKLPANTASRAALAAFAAAAAVWMLIRVLAQQPTGAAWLSGAAVVVFMALMVESSIRAVEGDTVRGASTGLMLGLCAGALALLGASASAAQIGIALGAGSGGALLVQMVLNRRTPAGWTMALPAGLIGSLAAVLAVFTGSLRWWCLVPMLAIPWAARLVPPGDRPVWLTAIFTSLAAAVPLLAAVALAWFTGGTS